MEPDSSTHFRVVRGGHAALPASLEEPYRAFQARETAPPDAGRGWRAPGLRLSLLAGIAVGLGGLLGLALLWALARWVY